MSEAYAGKQIVGIDLHRRRSVVVGMTEAGQRLETVRISNDPGYLRAVIARAGVAADVVLEATYGCIGRPIPWQSWARRCIWRTRWG